MILFLIVSVLYDCMIVRLHYYCVTTVSHHCITLLRHHLTSESLGTSLATTLLWCARFALTAGTHALVGVCLSRCDSHQSHTAYSLRALSVDSLLLLFVRLSASPGYLSLSANP